MTDASKQSLLSMPFGRLAKTSSNLNFFNFDDATRLSKAMALEMQAIPPDTVYRAQNIELDHSRRTPMRTLLLDAEYEDMGMTKDERARLAIPI